MGVGSGAVGSGSGGGGGGTTTTTTSRKRERPGGHVVRVALSLLVSSLPVWLIILQSQRIMVDEYRLANFENVKTYKAVSNVSTLLAYQQSFGYFDDIPDAAWRRAQQRVRQTPRYRHDSVAVAQARDATSHHNASSALQYSPWLAPPLAGGSNHHSLHHHNIDHDHTREPWQDPGWWYAHNLPPVFHCFNMERVGGLDDGPKWTCDPHRLKTRPSCLIYSIGSAGQYQWERGLVDRLGAHCEIHVFDPGNYSTTDLPSNVVHYHQWGLKSSYETEYAPSLYKNITAVEMLTFDETLRRLGHELRVIDIFKLDCEKCEWSTYQDWIGGNIRQIIVEVHGMPSPYGPNEFHHKAQNVTDFFDAFQDHGFALYFKEPNVYTRGTCVEFGFIKLRSDFWGGEPPEPPAHR